MGTLLVHVVCVRCVVCVLVLRTIVQKYAFFFRVLQVKAGVESSTFPVGMELDSGLLFFFF